MAARLLWLTVLLLLPRLALAMDPWEPPGACKAESWNDVEQWREWNSHTPPDNVRHWAEERPRFANRRDVWRWLDRLYIAVSDGKVLTLADCAFGDDMHFYLYERYDEAGEFHIVRAYFYEDHHYALVMRRTGEIYAVPGLPIWSPDRTRFAYAVCDLLNGTEELAVMSISHDRPEEEAKVQLPCTLGSCKLVWEGSAMLSATCEDPQGRGGKREVVRLTRKGDAWTSARSSR
ncbi:MAG: hypothetical protein KIS73_09245 [Enhydrobacter sp.]|nr:hypothetical protein [Enhydrobacter sp.]